MASRRKKKKASFAAICWFLTLLVLFGVFIVKQGEIRKSLTETDFFGKVFGVSPGFIEKASDRVPAPAAAGPGSSAGGASPAAVSPALPPNPVGGTVVPAGTVSPVTVTVIPAPPPDLTLPDLFAAKGNAAADSAPASLPSPSMTTASLWFIRIDEDGLLARREVKRPLPKNDSPLQSAIQSLLMGPALPDTERGCVTLIPEGTRLQSINIHNGVATLSFSGEFEYNRFGVEGYIGQLEQIVYTATSFPTVNSVQFLVDGEKREYIGGEGVWIGSPLGRGSFR